MKVGIVTFHKSSNYGAVLQSFALFHCLKTRVKDVEIIDYDNRFISRGLKKIRFGLSLHYMYYSLQDIRNYHNNSSKINKFKHFISSRYNLSRKMKKKELLRTGYDIDILVSGSDQIWNPLLNNGFDEVYFGCFPQVGRKLSYASSVGNYDFSDKVLNNQLKTLLSDYSHISCREKSKELSNATGMDVVEVADPTLLLDKNEWKESLETYKYSYASDDYLLIYALNDFNHIITIAERIAKEKGLKVFFIGNHNFTNKDIVLLNDLGPEEFINYFDHADYIVTNSFHGTAFSVIFGKQFVSVYNDKSPERARSLLQKIGLSSRLVKNEIPSDIGTEELSFANEKLYELRQNSLKYLFSAVFEENR